MRTRLARCLADRRGAAAVELAVAGPFLILALVGLMEAARMLWTSHTLQYAVDETGRYAMIHRTGDTGALTTFLQSKLGGSDPALVIEVTQSTTAGITYVNIAARKPFDFAGGLFGGLESTVGGATSVPLLPSS
jgi:Flp pilus assembly protein TadG